VDLRSVNSPMNQAQVNRSACSLDIFCCYEPKDYLRGKIKGVLPRSDKKRIGSNDTGKKKSLPQSKGWV
jgi:hypothetical protein